MKRIGIVTALAAEAAIARDAASRADDGAAPIVLHAGPGAARATRAARALLHQDCEALLSFGVAGGLDPALGAGTVVAADGVIGPDRSVLPTDDVWRRGLMEAGGDRVSITAGLLAGVDEALRDTDEKASLFRASGAVAVDMESFAIARIAHDAGIPFLGVRAIADPAARAVPEAALRALDAEGRIRPFGAVRGLLASPSEIWAFARVALDGRAAFAALRRVASLGPAFGLV